MTVQELQNLATSIAAKYTQNNKTNGQSAWDASAYMAGFVGDVGDLSKLIMAKSNLREIDDVDSKIAHELSDCLWSVLVLANELNIDLEKEFTALIKELNTRLGTT